MTSKDTKIALKEVREFIKNGKYNQAIEMCKKLLNNDKNNYMTLLLLGAAYQNVDKIEAAKYLRNAVDCCPEAPTIALQGLANCAPTEELPEVFEKLLDLVPDKFKEYHEKLYGLTANEKLMLKCIEILKKETLWNNEDRLNSSLISLARIWTERNVEIFDEDQNLFKTSLETVLSNSSSDNHLNCYKRYLKLLYKLKDYKNLIKSAENMICIYPEEVYPLEWICKVYCEKHNVNEMEDASDLWSLLNHPIEYYSQELLKLNPNSSLSLLIEAIDAFEKEQFIMARDILEKVERIQPDYHVAINLHVQILMKFGAYDMALPLLLKLNCCNVDYAECLSYSSDQKSLNEAIQILLSCEKNDHVLRTLARCNANLGQKDLIKELKPPFLAELEFLYEPTDAISYLKNLNKDANFETLLLTGKLLIGTKQFKDALYYVLQATRLRPYRSDCFLCLGKIYYALDDIVRAKKCLEKCVDFYPICEEAISNLSAIYQQTGDENMNGSLLLNALNYMTNKNLKWIHLKLGLHYMKTNKLDNAIQSFRTAIKCDVNCMMCWESLGDAYCGRGSYNSAIRVFQKILDMDSKNVYAKLQIAVIRTIIKMYTEAIEDFDSLLREHKNYLPGLKGAAEAHIGLANNFKIDHLLGRCKIHLQYAVNHLQSAFHDARNQSMVWLWRLTANVFVQVAQMPKSLAHLEVSGKLAKRDDEIVILTQKDLLELAVRFYMSALKLNQNSFLWYELSLCCYYCAKYITNDEDKHMDMAIKACKMALTIDTNRWQYWNLLGVLNTFTTIQNYPLAQHCYIQALQIDRKSYTTWSNLGVLYMQLGDIKLANQAFKRAQQSNPIYPNAWIGQAIIAEQIGEEEEALDLFRHCTQFEYHPETSIGYAHWVCTVLGDQTKCQLPYYKHAIQNMFADTVASDAINWYCKWEEDECCIEALSYAGFLNSRHKLWQPAIDVYRRSVKKAEGNDSDKLFTNLGYTYLKANRPEEAINAFNSVSRGNFKPIIGLALAYFRSGQHQEAYSVYSSILKSVSENEEDKAAMILVAMASMVYASQGEADTKTILYQCILLKNSPIQALYSAFALGILHGDEQLCDTMLNELKKNENSFEDCSHIVFLTSQYYLAKNETRKGLAYLISRVHTHPHYSKLRSILANYLIDNYETSKKYYKSTSQIALSTIDLGHRSYQKNSCIDNAECLLVASRALEAINKYRSVKLIQKAIHLYPQNMTAWQALSMHN